MIKLIDINEENWIDVRKLEVSEDQQAYLDSPPGIIARGYVYRSCNARVIGIVNDEQIIGAALVRDMNEEPAGYDLQQLLIDRRFQNKGYGTQALKLIIAKLQDERRFDRVEVCVSRSNAPALHAFEKIGFKNTGHIDADIPDSLNLMYRFEEDRDHKGQYTDELISDFMDPKFKAAFKQYFSELGIDVSDWDGLFKGMNDEGSNLAFVRSDAENEVVGFIQIQPIVFKSWFFEETYGFIREFWVAKSFRNKKQGSELLNLAERYFLEQGIYNSILTSETAEQFYLKHGYVKAPGCKALNKDDVYVKRLI